MLGDEGLRGGARAKEDRSFAASASAGAIRFNPLAAAIEGGGVKGEVIFIFPLKSIT